MLGSLCLNVANVAAALSVLGLRSNGKNATAHKKFAEAIAMHYRCWSNILHSCTTALIKPSCCYEIDCPLDKGHKSSSAVQLQRSSLVIRSLYCTTICGTTHLPAWRRCMAFDCRYMLLLNVPGLGEEAMIAGTMFDGIQTKEALEVEGPMFEQLGIMDAMQKPGAATAAISWYR